MRVLLVTIGSHGDVHPFVGIGVAMRDRGHHVTVMTSGYFEPLVRRERLDFVPLSTAEEFRTLIQNPDLWHRRRAFKIIAQGMAEHLEKVYRPIAEYLSAWPKTVIVASTLAVSARIAQEKLGCRLITVHLSPAIFRSALAPPRLPGVIFPDWLPRSIVRMTWSVADWLVLDPLMAPPINAFRASLGLPAVRGIMRQWWNSPDCVIGLFPEWFAPPQLDWPPQARLSGFVQYDEREHEPLPRALSEFLESGEPPIVFTPGSAMLFARSFFEAAASACGKLHRRGILLSRHPENIPPHLPVGVIHVDYAPFSALLPRAAALVHHGGIGTTAQALRAGVRQLILPMAHDQLDNAARVQKLGVGAELSPRRATANRLAEKLGKLLADPVTSASCDTVRARAIQDDGVAKTCDLIERFAR